MAMKEIQPTNVSTFEELQGLFETYKLKETKLYENCLQLINGVKQVSSFAHEYNFANVQANGYFSFVKVVIKFLNLVENKLRYFKMRPELTIASSALVKMTNNVMKIRKVDQEEAFFVTMDENVNPVSVVSKKLFPPKSYQIIFENIEKQEVVSIYNTLGSFWYPKSIHKTFEMYFLAVIFSCSKRLTTIKCFFSRNSRIKRFVEVSHSEDIQQANPLQFWHQSQSKFVLFLTSLISCERARVDTIYVPSQSKYVINQNASTISINYSNSNQTSDRRIRCRLITNRAEPEVFVFHVHGGGFISGTPDGQESYLLKWSDQNPNTVILSVSYTLAKLFPAAIQDVLDAYLAVTSQSQESILKFKPKKIILIGDSAGGNMIVSITYMLNDLKHLGEEVTMPNSIIPIYPTSLNTILCSPADNLHDIDPVITGGVARLVFYKLFGFNPRLQVTPEMTEKEIEAKFANINPLGPYIFLLNYKNFETLSEISMYIVGAEFCPLLDESVALAKKWKGPIKLEVLSDLPHGFLNFAVINKECRLGVTRLSEIIKELALHPN